MRGRATAMTSDCCGEKARERGKRGRRGSSPRREAPGWLDNGEEVAERRVHGGTETRWGAAILEGRVLHEGRGGGG